MTFPKLPIKLVVGLGNPGPEYERTRHNAGFWFAEDLAHEIGGSFATEPRFFGLLARGAAGSADVRVLKPQKYMNLSGQSVAAVARFFAIDASQILVAHDELDLPAGDIKLKFGGGHAGHNGLRDIQAKLGSGDYWRLRIGIGHPGVKTEVMNYVLGKPQAAQREAIEAALAKATGVLDQLLAGEMARATSALHTTKPPRPKPPRPEGLAAKPPGPVDPAPKEA